MILVWGGLLKIPNVRDLQMKKMKTQFKLFPLFYFLVYAKSKEVLYGKQNLAHIQFYFKKFSVNKQILHSPFRIIYKILAMQIYLFKVILIYFCTC